MNMDDESLKQEETSQKDSIIDQKIKTLVLLSFSLYKNLHKNENT